jgi:hypothetical protein
MSIKTHKIFEIDCAKIILIILLKSNVLGIAFLLMVSLTLSSPIYAGYLYIEGNVSVENISTLLTGHQIADYQNKCFQENILFNNSFKSPTIDGKVQNTNYTVTDYMMDYFIALFTFGASKPIKIAGELLKQFIDIAEFPDKNTGFSSAYANFQVNKSSGPDPGYNYFNLGKLGLRMWAYNYAHAWAFSTAISTYNFDVISSTDKPIKLKFSADVSLNSFCDRSSYFDYYTKVRSGVLSSYNIDDEDPLWFTNYIYYIIKVGGKTSTKFISGPYTGIINNEIDINPYDPIVTIEMTIFGVAFSGFDFEGDDIPEIFSEVWSYNSLKVDMEMPKGVICTTDYGVTFGKPIQVPNYMLLLLE